ncbi:MAG: type III toxin-antitoxin system ToxN/AbiQ family toxin [Sporomusaceae bacterium]|jgi:protein AbiQ|nr:type III toxin-antitoxin system ToxN/AbiQ family toxin [Sporomusaceae bacterium]
MSLLWKYVDEEYLNWIRIKYEARIPNTDYGEGKYKPFFGSLFRIGELIYVTQVSSPKPRHNKLKNSIDFFKIHRPVSDILIAVVNLNFMFPVHESLVKDIEYRDIDKYCSFKNTDEKNKYIDLMRVEMQEINKLDIVTASKRLYQLKYDKPNHNASLRCFDFKNLEKASLKYMSLLH